MEREVFAQRFLEAAERARDSARELIEEALPDPLAFRVVLNASYDGNPLHEDERVFPEDGDPELARRLSRCRGGDVVDVLWRDGMVPEWVNLSVIGELGTATLIEVLACGRFTANDRLLYHAEERRPPFHVLGPGLPVDYEHGQKFSIYDVSACRTRDDLDRTARHAARVESLHLSGEEFDDDVIAALPVFPRLRNLTLDGSPLNGRGLARLGAQPALRLFRLELGHDGPFTALHLPRLPRLASLALANLPAGPRGLRAVATHATGLERLSLGSAHDLVLDARLRGPLADLELRARSIEGDPLPEKVASLALHVREARDEDVARLLAQVDELTHLSLRGTRVSEGFVESLVSRWKLESLDVTDTSVGEACVRRIRARNPKLRVLPRPPKLERDT